MPRDRILFYVRKAGFLNKWTAFGKSFLKYSLGCTLNSEYGPENSISMVQNNQKIKYKKPI